MRATNPCVKIFSRAAAPLLLASIGFVAGIAVASQHSFHEHTRPAATGESSPLHLSRSTDVRTENTRGFGRSEANRDERTKENEAFVPPECCSIFWRIC